MLNDYTNDTLIIKKSILLLFWPKSSKYFFSTFSIFHDIVIIEGNNQ